MLIPVIYPSGSHDLVKDFYLDHLIGEKKITRFKRSSGWVNIDSAYVRRNGKRNFYTGPERRQPLISPYHTINASSRPIEFYPVDSFERFEQE